MTAASNAATCLTACASMITEVVQMADQRRHAVVAQAAGVDTRGHEGMAQGVHLEQRRRASGVAKVVGVGRLGSASGKRPARRR